MSFILPPSHSQMNLGFKKNKNKKQKTKYKIQKTKGNDPGAI